MKSFCFLSDKVIAKCDKRMSEFTMKKLWESFSFHSSVLSIDAGEENTFSIGNSQNAVIPEDKEYVISVTENGIFVKGKDYGGLMRGFTALIMKMELIVSDTGNNIIRIPVCDEVSNYEINNRMIHICVFPENDLYFIKKLIRLAGICQYTHIVIEFWGMLKYDCLKELAWKNAFSKEEARQLIAEAEKFGMKTIPMFNMLGHATASRVCYGKHVVLDQNPRLARLFTPDGWSWNINSNEVFELLKKIRFELYELFENTEYIHIGCDEAYYFQYHDAERKKLPNYLKRLTDEVVKEGKKPMMWMDMVLDPDMFSKDHIALGNTGETEEMLLALNNETIMVDWQYNRKIVPVETSMYLKDKGEKLLIAPWFDKENYTACNKTAAENNLFGVMLTTWHTLKDKMPSVLGCAVNMGAETLWWSSKNSELQTETATLLRYISFEGNNYFDSGWSKTQINI